MIFSGSWRMRAAMLACLMLALSACGQRQTPSVAPFYLRLDQPAASVDVAAAAEIFSAYRRNHGLGALTVDPALVAEAQASAQAAARVDRPASADALKVRLGGQGVTSPGVNLSAGYRTLAEAFSGWRESPQHNRVLLQPSATRFGIAIAYAPGSKYKVYWTLIVAGG